VFDVQCKQFGIEHRLIPPRHPQTYGMVERFNGRISEIVDQTRFASAAELESTLRNYVKIYNHNIPQRALKHQTPIQALKKWQQESKRSTSCTPASVFILRPLNLFISVLHMARNV
jgi:transposase InsO family protein